jgi:L-alanine-DL-glutamate epimerase-like enolase superfamily enzyme
MSIRLHAAPFDLAFKHPFTVSGFSRTHTPIVLIQLEYNGVIGYGEATMPPYLGESQESVLTFLKKINLNGFKSPEDLDGILDHVDSIETNNNAAKAGFDIALHDLICKLKGITLSEFYGIERTTPLSSFTIGIDTPLKMAQKVEEAIELGFKVLKIKLGSHADQLIMQEILKIWKGPFSIDANQGWHDKERSLDFVFELREKGAVFIEQPFPKEDLAASAWLTERSSIPIIADESVKRLTDLSTAKDCFHGINVKLMKSTGLREAHKMILKARELNMKVVTGCMAESSCAVTAMANLAPLADWVDLDGPFLITNDPFTGVILQEGRLIVPDHPGTGVQPLIAVK